MSDYDPTRTGSALEILKTDRKSMPQNWQNKGFTEGEVWVTVSLKPEGKYAVAAHAESPQDVQSDESKPSRLLGMVPTTLEFDTEDEAKQYAQELLADSENWDDQKYN